MAVPAFVTPGDMERLFPSQDLLDATNQPDGSATEINQERLQEACDSANGMAYGWLSMQFWEDSLELSALNDGLKAAFRSHCANLARFQLDGSTEEVKLKAEQAISFFEGYAKKGSATSDMQGLTPGIQGESMYDINFEVNEPPYQLAVPVWTADRIAGLGV